jgi:hypothetical protein
MLLRLEDVDVVLELGRSCTGRIRVAACHASSRAEIAIQPDANHEGRYLVIPLERSRLPSPLLRATLAPLGAGLVATVEFEENRTVTSTTVVAREHERNQEADLTWLCRKRWAEGKW